MNERVRRSPTEWQATFDAIALDPVDLLRLDALAIGTGSRDLINILKPGFGVEQLRRGTNNPVRPHVLAIHAIEVGRGS